MPRPSSGSAPPTRLTAPPLPPRRSLSYGDKPDRRTTAGLQHHHVADTLADLLEEIAAAPHSPRAGWQVVQSSRVTLGQPMVAPQTRQLERSGSHGAWPISPNHRSSHLLSYKSGPPWTFRASSCSMRTADPAVEDAMSLAYLAQDADHQKIEWLHGGIMSVLLDGDKTNGQLGMVRTHGGAGAAAPVHVHSHEDEVFLVLEGSGIFWVGDQRHQVSAGGVAYLPRGLPHAYRMTSEHFDVITLCTPAGVERFFRAARADRARNARGLPRTGPHRRRRRGPRARSGRQLGVQPAPTIRASEQSHLSNEEATHRGDSL